MKKSVIAALVAVAGLGLWVLVIGLSQREEPEAQLTEEPQERQPETPEQAKARMERQRQRIEAVQQTNEEKTPASADSRQIVYNGKEISNVRIIEDWAEGHRATGRARVQGRYKDVVIYYDQNWNLLNVRDRETGQDLQ